MSNSQAAGTYSDTVSRIEQRKKRGGRQFERAVGEGRLLSDLFTGRLMYVIEPFQNKTGMPLALIYNSDDCNEEQEGANVGYGWRIGAMSRMIRQGDALYYEDGSGSLHECFHRTRVAQEGTSEFDGDENRWYYLTVDTTVESYWMTEEGYRIQSSGSAAWQMYVGENTLFKFEANKIKEVHDNETGDSTYYTYDTSGKLTKITEDDAVIEFSYNASGRLSEIKKGEERVNITYNTSGRVSVIGYRHGNETAYVQLGSFQYSGSRLSRVTDESGYYLTILTDTSGRTQRISEHSTYSAIGTAVTIGAQNGNEWTISYATAGRTRVTDRNGQSLDYMFGKGGRVVAEAEPVGSGDTYEVASGRAELTQVQKVLTTAGYRQRVLACSAQLDSTQIVARIIPTPVGIANGNGSAWEIAYGTNMTEGMYVFCCWAKASSKSGTMQYELNTQDTLYQLKAASSPWYGIRIKLQNGNEVYWNSYTPLNEEDDDWQYIAIPLDFTGGVPSKIRVEFVYKNNEGTAYIKEGALYRTDGQAMYMIDRDYSVQYGKEKHAITLYDLNGRPYKRIIRRNGENESIGTESISYLANAAYESPESETDIYGVMNSYTYDDKRRCVKKRRGGSSLAIEYSRTYDGTSGMIASETTDAGQTVSYTRDARGNETSRTQPGGIVRESSYDIRSRLTMRRSRNLMSNANTIGYNRGLMISCQNGSASADSVYAFVYDGFGRIKEVKENGTTVKSLSYSDFGTNTDGVTGAVSKTVMTYANGYSATAYGDKYGQTILTKEGSAETESREYDAQGKIKKYIDKVSGIEYNYNYEGERLKGVTQKDEGATIVSETYSESYLSTEQKQLARRFTSFGGQQDVYSVKREEKGRVTSEETACGVVTIGYDGFGRVSSRTGAKHSESYGYLSLGSGKTSVLRNEIIYDGQAGLKYEYDGNGNITAIRDRSNYLLRSYGYDSLNRLVRENIRGKGTIVYGYDARGNRSSKKEYAYTTGTLGTLQKESGYSYSGDRMTLCGGQGCTYDDNGNPMDYCGKTLTWTRGRLLGSYETTTFAYNAAGQRTGKTANGRVTEYLWSGERLLGERVNNGSWTRYYYDSTGIIGYSVGSGVYTFRKNLQGDITGIYDENGVLFGEYEYDAWGNVLEEKLLVTGMYTPLHNNPFRYRGYYYDLETGLYYLNSRYYDPKTGRFLNQDLFSYLDPETVNGLNLYAYCGNNPVNYVDPTGHDWWHWLIGGVIISTAAVLTVVTAGGFAAAGTAILSVFTATMAPTALSAVFAGAMVGSAVLGASGLVIGGLFGGNEWSWDNAARGFMWGSIVGAVVGAAWGGMHYVLQDAGKMAIKTNIKNLFNNPLDDFVTIGPKDGAISKYVHSISQTGDYGQIFAKNIGGKMFEIADGHHRVAALIKLGYKYVKFFLVK